ncbi:MAG: nucleoside 2-deoxyribosyltransferase [Ferruginibacter sp.]
MTAYLALSFNNQVQLKETVSTIKKVLEQKGIGCFVFTDNFSFGPGEEIQMMQEAMAAIDNCDILVALADYKAIGIGVEAGYARAKNKKVIYIRHADAEHSTTVAGISHLQVIYKNMNDLVEQLGSALSSIRFS